MGDKKTKSVRQATPEDLRRMLAVKKVFLAVEDQHRHRAAVLAENQEALRLVVAWPIFRHLPWTRPRVKDPPIIRKKPAEGEKKGPIVPTQELWYWLWKGYYVTSGLWDELARHTGIPRDRVRPVFDTVMCNRMIYPDGGVAAYAEEFCRHEVARRFKGVRL